MAEPAAGGGPAAAGRGAHPSLDILLELQQVDTTVAQLRHRRDALPERQELQRLSERARALRAELGRVEQELADLGQAQRRLEEQIGATGDRRAKVEQQMYASRGLAPRDLEAMRHEIQHLDVRRRSLEDEELEIMVRQEPLEAERRPLVDELQHVEGAGTAAAGALSASESAIDRELAEAEGHRRELAASLPPSLVERYERIRRRLGGVGAARLVGDHCDGCHLALPSVEVERIHRLPVEEIATCDNCGRLLLRPEQLAG